MTRKGYLSARSARWISCLSEKERERERELQKAQKYKQLFSLGLFPNTKANNKNIVKNDNDKNSVPGQT